MGSKNKNPFGSTYLELILMLIIVVVAFYYTENYISNKNRFTANVALNPSYKNNKITGHVTSNTLSTVQPVNPSQIIINPNYNPDVGLVGNITYNNSFNINISYNYYKRWQELYKIVKNIISKCKSKSNIASCVNTNMKTQLKAYNYTIIPENPNIFYNISDYYTQCSESKTDDCVCPLDTSNLKYPNNGIDILFYHNTTATYFVNYNHTVSLDNTKYLENDNFKFLINSNHYDMPNLLGDSIQLKETISNAPPKSKGNLGILLSLISSHLHYVYLTSFSFNDLKNPEQATTSNYLSSLYNPKATQSKTLYLFYKKDNNLYITKRFNASKTDYAYTLFKMLIDDIKKSNTQKVTPCNEEKTLECNAKSFCKFLEKNHYNVSESSSFSNLCNANIPKYLITLHHKKIDHSSGKCEYVVFDNYDEQKIKDTIKKHLSPSQSSQSSFQIFVGALNNLKKNPCTLVKHRYQFLINDSSLKKPLLYYNQKTKKYELRYPTFNIAFYVP